MLRRRFVSFLAFLSLSVPAFAQVDTPKTTYYVGMGDSVAAGEGALPVTGGFIARQFEKAWRQP